MKEQFARTQLLLGADGLEKLARARVAVFGVGGVGGYVVEALARSGVGAFDLIDNDTVCLSNLNRQIIATRKTVGQYKVDVAAARIRDINPEISDDEARTIMVEQILIKTYALDGNGKRVDLAHAALVEQPGQSRVCLAAGHSGAQLLNAYRLVF